MREDKVNEILELVYQKPTKLPINTFGRSKAKEMLKRIKKYDVYHDFINSDKETWDIISKSRCIRHVVRNTFISRTNFKSGLLFENLILETFSGLFGLTEIYDALSDDYELPKDISEKLPSNTKFVIYNENISDVYIYLVGGSNGNDAVLYYKGDLFRIEVKDEKARSGEVDIDGYTEDGKLIINDAFREKHKEYVPVVENFNKYGGSFIDRIGSNIRFSDNDDTLKKEIVKQYFVKNKIDFLLTVDAEENLIVLTKDDVDFFNMDGSEIRTAGKNAKKVFTPLYLQNVLNNLCAEVIDSENELYRVPIHLVKSRIGRETDGEKTGYKLSPVLFVRLENTKEDEKYLYFSLKDVLQLKPIVGVHLQVDYGHPYLRRKFYFERLHIDNEEDRNFVICKQLSLFDLY